MYLIKIDPAHCAIIPTSLSHCTCMGSVSVNDLFASSFILFDLRAGRFKMIPRRACELRDNALAYLYAAGSLTQA